MVVDINSIYRSMQLGGICIYKEDEHSFTHDSSHTIVNIFSLIPISLNRH